MDVACGNAVEFLEDMLLVLFGDADAVVGNLEDGKAWFGAGGDGDVWLAVGIFDGVVDEVVQHVGDVQVVGIECSRDVTKVSLDGAVAVLEGEFEILYRGKY